MDTPVTPPPWRQTLRDDPDSIWLLAPMPPVDGYPHYDDLLQLPEPEGLTHPQWWVRLKWVRRDNALELPILRGATNAPLTYTRTTSLTSGLNEVAPEAAGEDPELDSQVSQAERDMFLEWTLREEAIASAQISGAKLTRSEALAAFDNGTIGNTAAGANALGVYRAMAWVFENFHEPITPERIAVLNEMMTGEGAIRTGVDIMEPGGKVWYQAPPADEIDERLSRLCEFAAREDADPLLDAMAVQWMIIHDQYFAQANNRTSRVVYYWMLLRGGFWLARHLIVSKVLAARDVNYHRSFLLTATDDGDLTYFFEFSLSVLRRAIWQLRARLESELQAAKPTRSQLLGIEHELNHRQLTLMETCLAEPRSAYTYETHAAFWSIGFDRARKDIRQLGKRGLLVRQENSHIWQAPDDLLARLRGEAPASVEMGDPAAPPQEESSSMQRLWRFVRNLAPGS